MSLTRDHLQMLTQDSSIARDVADERGWRSLTARETAQTLPPLGFSAPVCQLGAGLLFPLTLPDDPAPLYQFRPEHPRPDAEGSPIKYEIPHKRPQRLIFHPRVMAALRAGDSPVYVTEGAKKVDSLISRGATALGLIGVWSFSIRRTAAEKKRGTPKVLLPDWKQVQLAGRRVVIVFDSDAALNTDVDRAEQELAALLRARGAQVQRVRLPAQPDGRKQGVDDYFAHGYALADLEALVEPMPRPRFDTISAKDLFDKKIAPARWVIPGKLPVGATLFYGRSKDGKSLMVWNIAMAVVTGGKALGTYDVEQGDALYLALEDGERRGQERLIDQMLHAGMTDPPSRLDLKFWQAPRIGAGFMECLETWVDEHPEGRLVVVDILEKIRPPRTQAGVYTDDYNALEDLQAFGQRHNIAILIVHHSNKGNPSDFRESASGSQGLTGACDTLWNLRRNADNPEATLKLISREFDKHDLALRFADGFWSVEGEPELVRMSPERQAILDVLRQSATPRTPTQIATALDKNVNTTKLLLRKLALIGAVIQPTPGHYALPDHSPTPTVNPINPINPINPVNPINSVDNPLENQEVRADTSTPTPDPSPDDGFTEWERVYGRNSSHKPTLPIDNTAIYGPTVYGFTGFTLTATNGTIPPDLPVAPVISESSTEKETQGESGSHAKTTGCAEGNGTITAANDSSAPWTMDDVAAFGFRLAAEAREARRAAGAPLPCVHCQGTVFWTNAGGQPICVRCHPQPKGA